MSHSSKRKVFITLLVLYEIKYILAVLSLNNLYLLQVLQFALEM